jgi:hypothetical protein
VKISKVIRAVILVALGFVLGLFYTKEAPKQPAPMTEKAFSDYIASKPNLDLLLINDGFFYYDRALIELHKQNPSKMCADLAEKFGLVLDENEIEMKINFFFPMDSIPIWQKNLYTASARYLRNNCGQYAAKWTVGNPNWKYYKKAVKFAVITQ